MSRYRLNKKRVAIALFIPIFIICLIIVGCNKKSEDINLMIDLADKTKDEIISFCAEQNLVLDFIYEHNNIKKDLVISQSIEPNMRIKEGDSLIVKLSLGLDYEKLKVNELGNVPIMMYHGIHNVTDNKYTGGNVDYDGYQRTAKAFREDLEFYYKQGYRMIRLNDYVNGIVDVEAGFSPLILTFDDGLSNNIKVTGLDDNGNIIIDPNSAVGILEEFKKKYPDFNVTATFFVNGGLFQQYEYNEKILKWMVDNGYDIGNHSYSHVDFTTVNQTKSVQEIGSLYNLLDKYIPGKYVNIVALPFGSPYSKNHANFSAILKGNYNDKYYETISTLMVGWEANYSPFSKNFDQVILKRIRAYDNNGKEFDIKMNFEILENNRYISDGNKDIITIPESKKNSINDIFDLEVVTY